MLQLKNIVKIYNAGGTPVEALKGVNISFRKNEFVSILGPSGCGKTTLLNIIGGLDKYTSGDIVIDGISTTLYSDSDWDSYRNHRIGFVFQSYNLIPHQTVLKNVELALTLSGIKADERRQRAIEALKKVGLDNQIDKLPSQLSGGQMQRVAIARAIVNNPEIILADEPTGALDTETSIQVMDILKKLSENKLIVMVTHNPDLAEKYSSRIIKLKDGEMKSDSNPFAYIPTDEKVKSHENIIQRAEINKINAVNTDSQNEINDKNIDEAETDGNKQRTDGEINKNTNNSDNSESGDKTSSCKAIKKHKKSVESKNNSKTKKTSMSFFTALSLSFQNLKTKIARTILTSFAGSIGIIGIALILSLSSGFSNYISEVQRNTLSNYPVEITKNAMSMSSFMESYIGGKAPDDLKEYPKIKDENGDKILPEKTIQTMLESVAKTLDTNDLNSFKKELDKKIENGEIDDTKISAISYDYNFNKNFYIADDENSDGKNYRKVNEIKPLEEYLPQDLQIIKPAMEVPYQNFKMMIESSEIYGELLDDDNKLIKSQYELLAGKFPDANKQGDHWEAVIVVDKYNRMPDYALYLMGLLDDKDVRYVFSDMACDILIKLSESGNQNPVLPKKFTKEMKEELFDKEFGPNYSIYDHDFKFEDLIGKEYNVILDGEYYKKVEQNKLISYHDIYEKQDENSDFVRQKIENSEKLQICGILRLKEGVTGGALSQGIYYTPAFTRNLIKKTNDIEVVKDFSENEKNQLRFDNAKIFNPIRGKDNNGNDIGGDFVETDEDKEFFNFCKSDIGMADENEPSAIRIYPTSFENKDYVTKIIDDYNDNVKSNNEENKVIKYTDYVGMMMSSVTTIIDAITYVLIAFVSISLIVSSIMIGVITYISVLERTKEIGILRAIGASKKDVGHVFNAETVIIGFVAGLIGIIITIILNIPINIIIRHFTGIAGVAALPALGAVILVTISILLTLLAGLIPSKMASKKDPVIALRSE